MRGLRFLLAATLLTFELQRTICGPPQARAADGAGSGIEAFENGEYKRALGIWRLEADSGDREAAFQVGYLYDTGKGVPEDNALAASWYGKAAVLGHPYAQYNLGAMFANGDGVVRDRVLAYMLFDLAADWDPDGARERDRLTPEMTPLEIARANRLTRLARHGDMAALLHQIEHNAFTDRTSPASEAWRIWSDRDLIVMAQRGLAELGYEPGPADGQIGARTQAAIRAFQKSQRLDEDGEVSASLLDALYKARATHHRAEQIPYGQGRFWRIEREGSPPSYILGTFHSNDPRILQLPPKVLDIFQAADSVALELRIYSQKTYENISPAAYKDLMIDDGRTLKEIIGADLYSDVVAALKPVGFSENLLGRFEPWGIYHLLTVTYNGYQPSEREGTFLDLWLGQKAVYYRKKLIGLESPREQIAVFSELPERDQVELLNSAIALPDDEISIEELKDLYLTGDLASIYRSMTQPATHLETRATSKVVERMLDNRNEVMVERMQELLRRGNAFIAVGAAHLPGTKGVLQLLADRGFKLNKEL